MYNFQMYASFLKRSVCKADEIYRTKVTYFGCFCWPFGNLVKNKIASTVGWGEYGTAGDEVGTLLSQARDVMEENVTS